jgi:hypothetical protein
MEKISKLDEKKMRILQERRQRLLNRGVPPDKVDEVMQREDYERLPAADKVSRLESLIVSTVRGIQSDLNQLHQNQKFLADSMDLNFMAFEQMLMKLGLTGEQQKEIMAAAEQVFAQREKERAEAEEAAQNASIEASVDEPGEAEVPEGATTFGG